jgi:hypothetical protein
MVKRRLRRNFFLISQRQYPITRIMNFPNNQRFTRLLFVIELRLSDAAKKTRESKFPKSKRWEKGDM